jgi:hypothetical protein
MRSDGGVWPSMGAFPLSALLLSGLVGRDPNGLSNRVLIWSFKVSQYSVSIVTDDDTAHFHIRQS